MRWLTRWNYFDPGSEGDRYVRRRTWLNFGLILATIGAAEAAERFLGADADRFVLAGAGLFFAVWITTGFARYLRCLDEMQKQIHYESIVFAYAFVMCAAVGFGLLHGSFGWTFNPLYLIGIELVRGAAFQWLSWKRT